MDPKKQSIPLGALTLPFFEMPSKPPTDLSRRIPIPASRGCRFNPWLFFGLLPIPSLFGFAATLLDLDDYGVSALITLGIFSIFAGLVCGVHFTVAQRSMAIGLKIVIGIISVVGCAGGAFALGIGGCYVIFFLSGA